MSDDKKTAPSGEAQPAAEGETTAVKPIVRRRVAKSAATAERPTFQDVPEAPAAASAPEGDGASDFALPAVVSASDGAPPLSGNAPASTGAPASGPASTPRPDSRGTGRSADGRWDMRAPPRAGGRPGFRGAPGADAGGYRRPGASGGRAMPFIPQRDEEGRPVED